MTVSRGIEFLSTYLGVPLVPHPLIFSKIYIIHSLQYLRLTKENLNEMSCQCSLIKTIVFLILHLTQEVHYIYCAIIP